MVTTDPVPTPGDGSAAISVALQTPDGLAFDSAGNLYIADKNDNRIRKVDTAGNISTVAGNGTPGNYGRWRRGYA